MPQIAGAAGRFMLQQMSAVAELERGFVAERTRAALQALRARGVRLGNPHNGRNRDGDTLMTAVIAEAGHASQSRIADERAADIEPEIAEARAAGVTSARGIASWLNDRGVKTARGGQWQATQVQRVLARLEA
jgi:DNA invertase Pin-like site-specific DNA recombinase